MNNVRLAEGPVKGPAMCAGIPVVQGQRPWPRQTDLGSASLAPADGPEEEPAARPGTRRTLSGASLMEPGGRETAGLSHESTRLSGIKEHINPEG